MWPFGCYPHSDLEPFLEAEGVGCAACQSLCGGARTRGQLTQAWVMVGVQGGSTTLPAFPPLYTGKRGLFPFFQFQFPLAQVPRSTVESPDHFVLRASSGLISCPTSLPSKPHCPYAFHRQMVGSAVLWVWRKHTQGLVLKWRTLNVHAVALGYHLYLNKLFTVGWSTQGLVHTS